MGEFCTIKDSLIHPTSEVHDFSTIIKSTLTGHNFVGRFSSIMYSKLGQYSYVSQFSILKSCIIGNFTSISWGCSIGPEDHDYGRLTTHSFLISTDAFKLLDEKVYSPFTKNCNIGSDIWIGCNSTVLRGVTIGCGAVIGANSVVTKDVPPFAIVVGSPAKILKYRFDERIINELLEIKWWDFNDDQILKCLPLFRKEKVDKNTLDEFKRVKNNEKRKS